MNYFRKSKDFRIQVGVTYQRGLQVSVVLVRVVVLVVEGRVSRRPVHHLLTVHHVAHGRAVRAVRSAGTCVRRKHCYRGHIPVPPRQGGGGQCGGKLTRLLLFQISLP